MQSKEMKGVSGIKSISKRHSGWESICGSRAACSDSATRASVPGGLRVEPHAADAGKG